MQFHTSIESDQYRFIPNVSQKLAQPISQLLTHVRYIYFFYKNEKKNHKKRSKHLFFSPFKRSSTSIKKKHTILGIIFLLFAIRSFSTEGTLALIGGLDQNGPYTAFISKNGSVTSFPGWTNSGVIMSVALNSDGISIVGGGDNNLRTPYAARIFPNNSISPLLPLPASTEKGIINSVAINSSNAAIIGGQNEKAPYAGYIFSQRSSIKPISINGTGTIWSVAMNAKGNAIIGGQNNDLPYAALISSTGDITRTFSNFLPTGLIISVAINPNGQAIMGGKTNDLPYAALISSTGDITHTFSASEEGTIYNVAINPKGTAIIGGVNQNSTTPYAALITPTGTLKPLSLKGTMGVIDSVAINSNGTAIIGGKNNQIPYAALIAADNLSITPLSISTGPGEIFSVAINSADTSIIGGVENDAPYTALISPKGLITNLSGWVGNGLIKSVAIRDILDMVVPTSFGPGNSYVNTLMTELNFISDHLKRQLILSPPSDQHVTSAQELPPSPSSSNACTETPRTSPFFNACADTPYSLWAGFVGSQATQHKERMTPKMDNLIGGTLLGFDYHNHVASYDFCVGGATSYAFNYAHLSHEGHAKINQECLVAFGTLKGKHFLFESALWSGLYQTSNDRRTLGLITSTSHYHGWLLVPHLELNVPIEIKQNEVLLSPFVRLDWANNWQGKIREHGHSGFNLVIDSQYASLLRTEAGLRVFETINYAWGQFALEGDSAARSGGAI